MLYGKDISLTSPFKGCPESEDESASHDEDLSLASSSEAFSASEDEWKPSDSIGTEESSYAESEFEDSMMNTVLVSPYSTTEEIRSERKCNGKQLLRSVATKRKHTAAKKKKKKKKKASTAAAGSSENSPSASTSRAALQGSGPSKDDSDSDCSINDYLVNPNDLDLQSSFFDVNTINAMAKSSPHKSKSPPPVFNCDAGIENISDSSAEEEEPGVEIANKSVIFDFHNLLEKAQSFEKIKENIKKHTVEKKSTARNDPTSEDSPELDVQSLLALGETDNKQEQRMDYLDPAQLRKTKASRKKQPVDTDESEFEEVPDETTVDSSSYRDSSHTSGYHDTMSSHSQSGNLEIIVEMPSKQRQKKEVTQDDFENIMRRRLNRNIKQRQLLLHKATLLSGLARGLFYNRLLNNKQLIQEALKLLPSKNPYPPKGGSDIEYIQSLSTWFKSAITLESPNLYTEAKTDRSQVKPNLLQQIQQRKARCKQDLVMMFVILLRGMGIQCRLVLNLQPLPLKPDPSHLLTIKLKPSAKSKEKLSKETKEVKTESDKVENKVPSAANAKRGIASKSSSTKTIKGKGKLESSVSDTEKPRAAPAKKPISKKRRNPTEAPAPAGKSHSNGEKSKLKQGEFDFLIDEKIECTPIAKRTRHLVPKVTQPKVDVVTNKSKTHAVTNASANANANVHDDKEHKGIIPKIRVMEPPIHVVEDFKPPIEVASKESKLKASKKALKGETSMKALEPAKARPTRNASKDRKAQGLKLPGAQSSDNAEEVAQPGETEAGAETSIKALEPAKAKPTRNASRDRKTQAMKLPGAQSSDNAEEVAQPGKTKAGAETSKKALEPAKARPTRNASKDRKAQEMKLPGAQSSDNAEEVGQPAKTKAGAETSIEALKPLKIVIEKLKVPTKRTSRADAKDQKQQKAKLPTKRAASEEASAGVKKKESRGESNDHHPPQDIALRTRSRTRDKSPKALISTAFLQPHKKKEIKLRHEEDSKPAAHPKSLNNQPRVKISTTFLQKPTEATRKGRLQQQKPNDKSSEKIPQLDGAFDFVEESSKQFNFLLPQLDGADDVTSPPKKSKRRQLKKLKLQSRSPEEDSDEDFEPSPPKKPKSAPVLPKQVQKVRSDRRVLSTDNETEEESKQANSKKQTAADMWVEVWSEVDRRWICVDLTSGKVDSVESIRKNASSNLSYVFAYQNDLGVKDVTARYCPDWCTIIRKFRVDKSWLSAALSKYSVARTERDIQEDQELRQIHEAKPLPTAVGDYKNHPLYALKRHLLQFEAIYPPDVPSLGFVRGEAVYPRDCVHILHSREIWMKQARVVRLGEQPYKIIKRPKWDKFTRTILKEQPLEIFGYWQTDDYDPPTAANGIVPRNEYGNVELFKPCMLPKKTVHIRLPDLNRVCKKLGIDCARAVTGFDFHQGFCHPMYDGFVVCEEFAKQVVAAWHEEQDELDRKDREKYEKRVYGNWKKLTRGLLIRERLKKKYDF